MDLTNSTKLVSTDMVESSHPHGIHDSTMGKESLLNGKLAFLPGNFESEPLCAAPQSRQNTRPPELTKLLIRAISKIATYCDLAPTSLS